MREYRLQRARLEDHIDIICGIAMNLTGDPESVMCSQALFIGMLPQQAHSRQYSLRHSAPPFLPCCMHTFYIFSQGSKQRIPRLTLYLSLPPI